MIAEPSWPAAVHDTVAEPLPAVADTPVGASGTVDGTTAFEAAEAAPVPSALVAVTVKVYELPLVRPVTVHEVVAVVQVWPPEPVTV